jgi:hypothetical protein
MATKLFLRSTQANGIGATYFDMAATAGSGTATAVVNTAGSGTEIQWTQTAGGSVIQFVSGRAPSGGFTLTTTDISIWAQESGRPIAADATGFSSERLTALRQSLAAARSMMAWSSERLPLKCCGLETSPIRHLPKMTGYCLRSISPMSARWDRVEPAR